MLRETWEGLVPASHPPGCVLRLVAPGLWARGWESTWISGGDKLGAAVRTCLGPCVRAPVVSRRTGEAWCHGAHNCLEDCGGASACPSPACLWPCAQ